MDSCVATPFLATDRLTTTRWLPSGTRIGEHGTVVFSVTLYQIYLVAVSSLVRFSSYMAPCWFVSLSGNLRVIIAIDFGSYILCVLAVSLSPRLFCQGLYKLLLPSVVESLQINLCAPHLLTGPRSHVHNHCWPSMFVILTFQQLAIMTVGWPCITAFSIK